jgi:hypothetical protein
MKMNENGLDRIIRVVLGVVLIALWFMTPHGSWSWLYWIGVIPLVTGLVGWCPLYSVIGLSTKK